MRTGSAIVLALSLLLTGTSQANYTPTLYPIALPGHPGALKKSASGAKIFAVAAGSPIHLRKSLTRQEKSLLPPRRTSTIGETGYQQDQDTGLYYANQRYYDAEQGRFIREDPIAGAPSDPITLNRYLYAKANPGIFVDRDGRQTRLGIQADLRNRALLTKEITREEFIAENRAVAKGAAVGVASLAAITGATEVTGGFIALTRVITAEVKALGVINAALVNGEAVVGGATTAAIVSAEVASDTITPLSSGHAIASRVVEAAKSERVALERIGANRLDSSALQPIVNPGRRVELDTRLNAAGSQFRDLSTGRIIATKKTGKELTTFFPPNNGFLGSTTKTTLMPGQTIDRFGGSDVSRFFSPTGTPAAMRSLPPGTASQPLRSFEVLKPIGVESGRVAPAFNQIGLGTQFRSGKQLGELLDGEFLREIEK